jgi:hypothetical protein
MWRRTTALKETLQAMQLPAPPGLFLALDAALEETLLVVESVSLKDASHRVRMSLSWLGVVSVAGSTATFSFATLRASFGGDAAGLFTISVANVLKSAYNG